MRRLRMPTYGSALVIVILLITSPAHVVAQDVGLAQFSQVMRRPIPPGALKDSLNFARTELYFGTAREGAPPVSDEAFLEFLDL